MERIGRLGNIEENIRTLNDLGLSCAQSKIYLSLLANGLSSIKEVAHASNVARPDTYRALSRLQEIGIVEKIVALPTKVKALPIVDAIDILMLRRTRENVDLKKRAVKLIGCFKEKPDGNLTVDENQFVLIQGDAIERKLQKLLENSQENVSLMLSRKKMLQVLSPISMTF